MRKMKVCAFVLLAFCLWLGASEDRCGRQFHNNLCPNGSCCSTYGYCGNTEAYCEHGCQSNCWNNNMTNNIISATLFDKMLLHRNDPACPSQGFYTYNAFIAAARSFKGFLSTGNDTIQKRELAAFLGQTSHETTGGTTNDPYTWGYCFIGTSTSDPFCIKHSQWLCVPGKKYYARGPIQLSYNYNYGPAGKALGIDLLSNPDLVATDAVVSFKTAIWYWMTPQKNKPSSHDVITGKWKPSNTDIAAGRLPGYGVIINIINSGECGFGFNEQVENRIGFYKRYCDILGIKYGDNLDCYTQKPFDWGLKLSYEM